jgi:hypothetical protein
MVENCDEVSAGGQNLNRKELLENGKKPKGEEVSEKEKKPNGGKASGPEKARKNPSEKFEMIRQLLREKYREAQAADLAAVEAEHLEDISGIQIDQNQPLQDRIQAYVEMVGNPFLVRVGDYVVRLQYDDGTATLQDRIQQYIFRKAEGSYSSVKHENGADPEYPADG